MKIATLVTALAACTAAPITAAAPDAAAEASPDAPRAVAADAPQPAGCRLAVLFGQSNAGLKGRVSELAGSDAAIAAPLPSVPWIVVDGNETNSNDTPLVSYPLQALQPVTDYLGSAGTFGFEQSLGYALDAAQPGRWAIAQYSIGSTGLDGSWGPECPYYPTPALGSGWGSGSANMFQSEIALVQGAEAATGCEVGAFIWQQGEEDSTVLLAAQQYGLRLAQELAAERYALGVDASVPWFIGKLNSAYKQVGTALVQAGEESVAGPGVTVVDLDQYPLGTDNTHYSTSSIVAIGRAYAAQILATAP